MSEHGSDHNSPFDTFTSNARHSNGRDRDIQKGHVLHSVLIS